MCITKTVSRVIIALIVVTFSAVAFTMPPSHAAAPAKVAAPKGIKAKPGKRMITIKWRKNARASGYIVYMAKAKKNGKPGKFKKIATIKKRTTTRYIKRKLTIGKKYYFKAKAYKKKSGKKYRSKYSKTVYAYAGGAKNTKSPDYWHKKELGPLEVDKNGAHHVGSNASETKGAYALYVEGYPTLENKAGLVPVHVLKVKDGKCTVYYTTDRSTPSPANGRKVTKSSGTVKVYLDKTKHTYKVRGYVGGKEVFHDYFTDSYLYYYDKLPAKDPGPLVGGLYQGAKYGGLVDGLIWWQ
jgi:hypothetical protein